MCYEAKHAYFKSLSQSLGNFINLPYTLATRHQQHQCYLNTTKQQTVTTQLKVGPGRSIVILRNANVLLYVHTLIESSMKYSSIGSVGVPAILEEELGCPVSTVYQ